jgi:ABC-type tungstate transport system substrate-binding protein
MNSKYLIYIVIITLTLYAIVFELTEHHHSYMLAKPKKDDTINTSIHKLKTCIKYQFSYVAWRRMIICTVLFTLLVFSLVHRRYPTSKEILLYTIIGFVVLTLNRVDYQRRSLGNVVDYSKTNLKNIDRRVNSKTKYLFSTNKCNQD